MDHIREIVHTFSEDDARKFRFFINRSRQKNSRKDLDLFEIMLEEEAYKSKDMILRLYGTSNEKEAYHALRKRLLKHLTDFIVLRNIEEEETSTSTIMRDVSLGQYLISNKHFSLSLRYLSKAENHAQETEQFDILNSIYNYMIEYYEVLGIEDLEALIEKRNQNQILLKQDENSNIAYSLVRNKLKEFRLNGIEVKIDDVIEDVLDRFQLKDAVFTKPRLLYKLVSITRSSILAKKDFSSFEPFIIERYELLKNASAFTSKNAFYQLRFLYMIAHTLYRNRKFEQSDAYLLELQEIMLQSRKSLSTQFNNQFQALKAANSVFLIGAEQAAQSTVDYLESAKNRLSQVERLNFIVAAGIYYFMSAQYTKTHEMMLSIQHTDRWCEKIMGREWVFKKNLMEVLLFFEMEKIEVVESRIRSIERNFKTFFANPIYGRARVFLSLIREVALYPDRIRSAEFEEKVERSFEWMPQEQEDLQAMAFYAWLRSKMQNRPYMEVLQRLVSAQVN